MGKAQIISLDVAHLEYLIFVGQGFWPGRTYAAHNKEATDSTLRWRAMQKDWAPPFKTLDYYGNTAKKFHYVSIQSKLGLHRALLIAIVCREFGLERNPEMLISSREAPDEVVVCDKFLIISIT
jgi:hypothetical protein